jgi:hypothetical protein
MRSDPQDTGRLAFRTEYDPPDDRPLLVDRYGFWEDDTERMTYENAVEASPIRNDEGRLAYIARVSEVVTGKYAALGKSMPRRMSRRQRDSQLAKLRAQARGFGEGVEDYA